MLQSFRQCSCFSYLLNSKNSSTVKTLQLPVNAKIQSPYIQQNQQASQRNQLTVIISNFQANQIKEIGTQKKAQTINSKVRLEEMSKKSEKSQKNKLQRSMFQREQNESSVIDDSDNNSQSFQESDLPTQKSQIIINDINFDVEQLENNYLFSSQKKENLWDVYERIKTIQQKQMYTLYLVKNKINGQFATAKVFMSYSLYEELFPNLSQSELIQKYTEQVYEKAKNQIKCLIKLTKNSCRHICRIIDYQLKPPSYIGSEENFDQGYTAIVYQNLSNNLSILLQEKRLEKRQKKKIIYQLVCAINDIHQAGITICDFSIQNVQLDLFDNVKLNLPEMTQKINNKKISQISSNNFKYCSPQVLIGGECQFSNKLDLWPLGILIAKILGKQLFVQTTPQQQLSKIRSLLNQKKPKSNEPMGLICTKLIGLSFNELDLVESLLKFIPEERKQCKQLIGHKYFQNLMQDSIQYEVQTDQNGKEKK